MDSDSTESLPEVFDFGSELMLFAQGRDTERDEIERMRYLAIERLFVLIGEALKRALKDEPALAHDIPNINRIRGMRNRLAHEYDSVRVDIVWDAAEAHMPLLVSTVSENFRKRGAI